MKKEVLIDAKTLKVTGEPERYDPNKPLLSNMSFTFEQEGNCCDGGDGESITIEAKSSSGIDGDGEAFFVIRTKQWAFNNIEDLTEFLKRVEAAVLATNPTTMYGK